MRALVYGVPPEPLAPPENPNPLVQNLARTPTALPGAVDVVYDTVGKPETFEVGVRKHAIAHYLDLVSASRIDLRPMMTHTFRLGDWRDAFLATADQGRTGAVKVAIDQR